jgi:hypothetical protein
VGVDHGYVYEHVSGDFMNTALRKALAPALDVQPG